MHRHIEGHQLRWRLVVVPTVLALVASLTVGLNAPTSAAAVAFPADAILPDCTSVPARPAGTALDNFYVKTVWFLALEQRNCLDSGFVQDWPGTGQDTYHPDQVTLTSSQTTFDAATDTTVPITLSMGNVGPFWTNVVSSSVGPAEAFSNWVPNGTSDYPDTVRYRYRRVDGTWEPTWRKLFAPVKLVRTGTDCFSTPGQHTTVGGQPVVVAYSDGFPTNPTCAYSLQILQNTVAGYQDPDGVNMQRDLQIVFGLDWSFTNPYQELNYPYYGQWIARNDFSADYRAALNLFVKASNAPPPTVGISWAASGTPGTFDFSGNAAAASPATIVRYDWDFGDGDVRTDSTALQTKTWSDEAPTRTVSLTVYDSKNKSATSTVTLTPKLVIDSAPTDPDPVNEGDAGALLVKVRNDGPSTITGVTPAVQISPSEVAVLQGAAIPPSVDLAPGGTQVFRVPFQAKAAGQVNGTVGADGTSAGGSVTAATEPLTFTVGNPGIKLELSADRDVAQFDDFNVKLTITNPGADKITGITWGDPTGLALKTDVGPVPVSKTFGPDPALPTTLESNQVVTVTYRFSAPAKGGVVMTAEAEGTLPDSTIVKGTSAISVAVSFGLPSATQINTAMVHLINDTLTTLGDGATDAEQRLAAFAAQQLALLPPSPARMSIAEQLGIPAPLMGIYNAADGALTSAEDSYDALMGGIMSGFASKAGDTYKVGAAIVATAKDPVKRAALSNAIWQSMLQVPEATRANLGYLGQAAMAMGTIDGWKNIGSSNAAFLSSAAEATSQIASGELTLLGSAADLAHSNPKEFLFKTGEGIGGVGETLAEAWATGIVGKGLGLGVKTLAALPGMAPKVFMTSVATADQAIAAGLTAEGTVATLDAAEAMMARASQAMDTVQALAYDTKITAAEVVKLGGVPAADQAVLADILNEGKKKFGIAVAYEVRTSEPLSAGLDILAKPEFVKPKATSALDIILGAEEGNAGQVGLFDPTRPSGAFIEAAEARNPGFRDALEARFASQQKLWKQWNDTTSPLRQIVDGSKNGPVKVILDVPGRQKPFGIVFLEQLDDPAWVASKGMTAEQVAATRVTLLGKEIEPGLFANGWPRTFDVRLEAQASKAGSKSTTLKDLLSGKYLGSDLDGQGLAPIAGKWPSGVQGAYETWFQQQLAQRLPRFPFHGHSNSAYDLSSKYFQVAAEFTLNTTRPEAAQATAENLARMIVTTNNRLAGIVPTPGELQAAITAKASELMAGYKPEKTLLFINGDVLVSGGGFPK